MRHHHFNAWLCHARSSMTISISILLFLLFSHQTSFSQTPVITVRFSNPQFDSAIDQYCVDVEFKSDIPDQQVFGMNVRFFYDDSVLEFISFGDFQGGYSEVLPSPPGVFTSPSAGPALFNFTGAAEFVNGAIQLVDENATPIVLQTTSWTKVFQMCFNIDDPEADQQSFCPALVWDLEADPANGSFLPGSEGVVITVVDPGPLDSKASTENVNQFNWVYSGSGAAPYGHPEEVSCIALASWLSINCVQDINIECDESTDPAHTGSASANDNCAGDITITYTDQIINGTCVNEYVIIRTWHASNGCNSTGSCTQMIKVTDHTSPLITGVPDITCIGDPALNAIAASDNCGSASLSFTESQVPHPYGRGKAIRRIYTSLDACGNMSKDTVILLKKNECSRDANSVDRNVESGSDIDLDQKISTRTTDNAVLTMTVSPNPASDFLHIKFDSAGDEDVQFLLISLQGQIVRGENTKTVNGTNSIKIDVSSVAEGNYILQQHSNHKTNTQMVVILHNH